MRRGADREGTASGGRAGTSGPGSRRDQGPVDQTKGVACREVGRIFDFSFDINLSMESLKNL